MNRSRSIIQERQRQLFEYIKKNTSIKTSDASKLFQVSELTIRRDIAELEAKHLVSKFHGGAAISDDASAPLDTAMEHRTTENEHAKNCIGRKAASLVQDGSTVFLNSGSTTLSVLRYLNHKTVRIMTNNALASTAIWSEDVELIMTGGECRTRSQSLIGSFALNAINSMYGSVCIMGVNGISSTSGTTTSVHPEVAIKEAMVNRCNGPVIIVADGTKVGKSYNFISTPLQDIDILITDSSADPQELDRIAAKGVKVIVVDEFS